MSTLYQIDQSILDCIDMETGEIIDFEQLERLQVERNAKIENVVCWIKNLESDAVSIKTEADALIKRAKSAQSKANNLRAWLTDVLAGEKFNSSRCAVSWRKSEVVEIENKNKIPLQYMIKKVEYNPDKTTIKNMIKSGTNVPGCKIVQKLNVQIK